MRISDWSSDVCSSDLASGALTDPKYTRYEGKALDGVSPNQAIVTVDKSDYLLVGLVKKQYSVGANYIQDFGGVGLDANIVYAWQGRLPQFDIPASMFPSRELGSAPVSTTVHTVHIVCPLVT